MCLMHAWQLEITKETKRSTHLAHGVAHGVRELALGVGDLRELLRHGAHDQERAAAAAQAVDRVGHRILRACNRAPSGSSFKCPTMHPEKSMEEGSMGWHWTGIPKSCLPSNIKKQEGDCQL